MAVAPDDGDLSERIGFDIQIYCAFTKPFVEPPLFPLRQDYAEITRIVSCVMRLSFRDTLVIQRLSTRTHATNGRGREEIRPGGDPLPPQLLFGRASYPWKQTEGGCDHVGVCP